MRVYGNKSGKVDIYEIENTLEALQEFIGGYVEPLNLGNNLIMLFDEDGRMKQLPVTCVLMTLAMPVEIRGNYLIVRQSGSEFTDLTDEDITDLKKKGF